MARQMLTWPEGETVAAGFLWGISRVTYCIIGLQWGAAERGHGWRCRKKVGGTTLLPMQNAHGQSQFAFSDRAEYAVIYQAHMHIAVVKRLISKYKYITCSISELARSVSWPPQKSPKIAKTVP